MNINLNETSVHFKQLADQTENVPEKSEQHDLYLGLYKLSLLVERIHAGVDFVWAEAKLKRPPSKNQ